MANPDLNADEGKKRTLPKRGVLKKFLRAKGGAAAIEFAILVIPFFMIVMATIETFVAYNAEQVLAGAVDTFARKIRTGQITFAMGRPTDMTETQFRTAFCNELAVMITCDSTEPVSPHKLYIDLQSFSTFSAMPKSIPYLGSSAFADVDVAALKFNPGGAGKLTMLRAMYRWQIMTDLMRPYLTNIRTSSVPTDYLIVSTAAFKSESYP